MKRKTCRSRIGVIIILAMCAVLPAGEPPTLVAHWQFEEGSGRVAYDSAGLHNGQIEGNPTWVPGVVGTALHLDGGEDYIEVPDDASLRPAHITISAWISIDALTNHMMVVSKGSYVGSYNEQYAMHVRVDGIYWRRVGMNIKRNSSCEPWVGWYRAYSKTLLEMNTWYMVTGTWDGDSLRMYVNGVLEGEEWAPLGGIDDCPGGTLRIGRWRAGDEQRFFGRIDDVRIYNEALSESEVMGLYARTARLFYVDDANGSDLNAGTARAKAFATIQNAVDVAKDGDTVLVYPGVYIEAVSIGSKAITIRSAEDAAVIQSPASYGVSFSSATGAKTVLKNFVIKGSPIGVLINGGSPTIKNLAIVSCGIGIKATGGYPSVSNCILWNNTDADLVGCGARYCCIQRAYPALGNISADPLFADPQSGDYHLCSERGMYWPKYGVWVLGNATSPCIDAGDPADDYSLEPQPNGGRIDMGAHGGTAFASRSMAASSSGSR